MKENMSTLTIVCVKGTTTCSCEYQRINRHDKNPEFLSTHSFQCKNELNNINKNGVFVKVLSNQVQHSYYKQAILLVIKYIYYSLFNSRIPNHQRWILDQRWGLAEGYMWHCTIPLDLTSQSEFTIANFHLQRLENKHTSSWATIYRVIKN
jgi:hypothetical protein